MIVQVKLFALARQLAGSQAVDVQLAEGATVGHLRVALAEQYPSFAEIGAQLMFAVDADYADDTTIIPPGAEVACIPPVSGG